MATYIVLGNYTEQGIRNIKESPGRIEQVEQLAQQLGGRMQSWHLTIGPYDFVSTLELPDDEAAARLLLTVGMQGNVRTTTLKAISREDFTRIVGMLG